MTEFSRTVFVVDDDTSFLTSLDRLLRASGYSVKSFTSAAEFLAQQPSQSSGCVVADLQMPGMDGMTLQNLLARSDNPMPIVFLSGKGDIPTSVRAMRNGAEDFLIKTAPSEELFAAIERALARDALERNDRKRKSELQMRFAQLTPRENQVLTQILRGRLNKQIAADLGIGERSVKRHRTSLMRKLELRSVAELTQCAVEARLCGEISVPHDTLNQQTFFLNFSSPSTTST